MLAPEEALRLYVAQLRANGRSDSTVQQVSRHVRLLASWMAQNDVSCDLRVLGHETLAAFLCDPETRTTKHGAPKQPATLNALRTSLRTFFGYLRDAGLIAENPARLIQPARFHPKRPRVLTVEEEARLLDVLRRNPLPEKRRDEALILLLLRTGARLGEALGLQVEDIDVERREAVLRATKGGGEDALLLPGPVVEALLPLLAQAGAGVVFRGNGENGWDPRQARYRIMLWFQLAGIAGATPHTFRHTLGTRVYEATRDLLLVKEVLRHRTIASSQRYARSGLDRVREVLDGV